MAVTVSSASVSVLFLLGSPYESKGNFSSLSFADRASDIVKRAIKDLVLEEARGVTTLSLVKPMDMLKRGMSFLYSVQCLGSDNTNKIIDTCAANFTHHTIYTRKPKVIVAMGSVALKSLGLNGGIKNLRGCVVKAKICGEEFLVVPTISPMSLLGDDAGLYSIMKNDIARAATVAFTGSGIDVDVSELTNGYAFPNTLSELDALSSEFANYSFNGQPAENSMMSLDTETNTLKPWSSTARIIMLSAAVAPGKATAIFLEHAKAPYDWRKALPYALRITMSKNPKAWWNYKFDYQMFKYALMPKVKDLCISASYKTELESIVGHSLEGILKADGINNTKWDGLLGEHMLDEDKKGYYSLKTVVSDYVPDFSGYEEKLKDEFKNAQENKLLNSITEFKDPVVKPILGIDEEELPFRMPSEDKTYSELLGIAEDRLEKTIELRKAQIKKNYPNLTAPELAAKKLVLKTRENRLAEWVKREKSELKHYERFLQDYVVESKISFDEGADKEEAVTYEDLDPLVLQQYAAIDADVTFQICRKQRVNANKEDKKIESPGVQKHLTLMGRHYLPLTEALSKMQSEGVWVDKEYLQGLHVSIKESSEKIEQEIRDTLSKDLGINTDKDSLVLNNPKTLANIFTAYYGLPVIKRTDKGFSSVDEDTLQAYAEGGNEVAKKVLIWRKLGKAKSTYVDSFLDLSSEDGKIHGNIHINGTATGRCSSSTPNLQNTPHMLGDTNIKKSFIPSPIHEESWWDNPYNVEQAKEYGWEKGDRLVWVDLDFSGAEVRVLTRYAPDKSLIEALVAGLDVHSWMTSEIHGYTYDEVNTGRSVKGSEMEALRSDTKKVVFGTLYGITAHGLNARMGFTEERAQEIINKLMNRFPDIQTYIEDTKREISLKGFVVTPYGRFRRFPMAKVGRWMEGRNHRQGVNFLIQSYCSDIVMSCLKNIAATRREVSLRLLLTVHDSICFEMPLRLIKELPAYLNRAVEEHIKSVFPDMPVTMPYDVTVGYSYGETKDIKKFVQNML
jgi:DNA polymerase I-like protein with 3'-5' exonuclease and polymerase domains/uracil-DNA glycosylase